MSTDVDNPFGSPLVVAGNTVVVSIAGLSDCTVKIGPRHDD